MYSKVLPKSLLEFLEVSIQTLFEGINLFHNFVVSLVFAIAGDKFICLCNIGSYVIETQEYRDMRLLSSSVAWYMLCTFLIWGTRSGAPLNNPKIVLPLKDSDSSPSLAIPLLNLSNAWQKKVNMICEVQLIVCSTFRTFKKSLTLHVFAWMRETIRSRSGMPFATSVNVDSKVGWLMISSTASNLPKNC